jgi:hypothetical protein
VRPFKLTTIASRSSPLPTSRGPRNIQSGNVGPT